MTREDIYTTIIKAMRPNTCYLVNFDESSQIVPRFFWLTLKRFHTLVSVFVVNFEQISDIVLVSLLLTLRKSFLLTMEKFFILH